MNPQTLATKYRELIQERMSKYDIGTAHDDRSHWYTMDGKKYPSVTAKLQLIKDEGLMSWKMNRALEYLKPHLLNPVALNGQTPEERLDELFVQAKLAPQKEFEGAGSIGTAVHDWRAAWFQMLIDDADGYNANIGDMFSNPSVQSGIRGVTKFVQDTGYIPVATELRLANHKLQLGGSLDDIGILPHATRVKVVDPVMGEGFKTVYSPKLALIDLKTSNIGDKPSYFLQVALYYYMFKKLTGLTLQEFYILHVSKTDGTYKLIEIPNIHQRIKDAMILLKLNDSLHQIDVDKKKVPIVV